MNRLADDQNNPKEAQHGGPPSKGQAKVRRICVKTQKQTQTEQNNNKKKGKTEQINANMQHAPYRKSCVNVAEAKC